MGARVSKLLSGAFGGLRADRRDQHRRVDGAHAHGLNERIRVSSLLDGRRFLYEVVKLYGNSSD